VHLRDSFCFRCTHTHAHTHTHIHTHILINTHRHALTHTSHTHTRHIQTHHIHTHHIHTVLVQQWQQMVAAADPKAVTAAAIAIAKLVGADTSNGSMAASAAAATLAASG